MLLTEYDEQAHFESEREIWREEGEMLATIEQIRKKYIKNVLLEETAEMLELSVEYVRRVMEILSDNPNITDEDIVALLSK